MDTSTTTQNTVGHLPPDLLRETLSRLPVKSLLRFRCVSKHWLALVDSDADFARSHLNTFNSNTRDTTRLVLLHRNYFVWRCSEFEPVPATSSSQADWGIISSIDGLVLIRVYYRTKSSELKLWSPSLRQFRDVPRFPPDIGPILEDTELGFGYDPWAKDYKIVKLISTEDLHLVAIYAIGADSWKVIPYQGKEKMRWVASFSTCVSLNGVVYTVFESLNEDGDWDLVMFDLCKEVFSSVRSPLNDNDRDWTSIDHTERKELVLVGGGSSVAIFDYTRKVWVLERETMNWTKHRVPDKVLETHLCHIPILVTSVTPYAESLILHQYNAKARCMQ